MWALQQGRSSKHALPTLSDQLPADAQARFAPGFAQAGVVVSEGPYFTGRSAAGHAVDCGNGVKRPTDRQSLAQAKDRLADVRQSLRAALPCAGKLMGGLETCN